MTDSATLERTLLANEVYPSRELTPGRLLIARLVGRRFEDLLVQAGFDQPFDIRLAKAMVKTASHLAGALGAALAFAERSEISLFAVAGGGDGRRLASRLAGEASAKLSLLLGRVATFESRLFELEDPELVLDYFASRQEIAQSTALDGYCRQALLKSGADPAAIPLILNDLAHDDKHELLKQNEVEYAQLPAWQRLGSCVLLQPDENGNGSGPSVRILVDLNVPEGPQFREYLEKSVATR